MNLNQSELLNKINRMHDAILAIENRVGSIEQKKENAEPDSCIKERVQKLESTVRSLQRLIYGNHAPVSHQLAESVTGIIGLKESITIKHPILKYIWILLFCLGIGGTIFFICATTSEYLEEPTLTKVKVLINETYEFPPIVLCKYEWFDTEKAINLGMSNDTLKYSLGFLDANNYSFVIENISQARQNFLDIFAKHKFPSLIDYYKAIAVDLDPKLSEKDFMDSTTPSYVATKVRMEKTFLQSVCYTFFLPPVQRSLTSLYSYYDDPISIKFADKTAGIGGFDTNSWTLYFSKDTQPESLWSLLIKSSTTSCVNINVEKFIAYHKPEVPCVSADNYSTHTCMANCTNHIDKQILGCRLLSLSDENNQSEPTEYCNTFDLRADNLSLAESIQTGNGSLKRSQLIRETCYKQCPPKCERLFYEATMRGEDPALGLYTASTTNATDSSMSVTEIMITHGAMKRGGIVTYEELSSYSYIELVNNIGGTLGLFIGGTILTLAQFILFFVDYFCSKKQKATQVQDLHIDELRQEMRNM